MALLAVVSNKISAGSSRIIVRLRFIQPMNNDRHDKLLNPSQMIHITGMAGADQSVMTIRVAI